MILICILATERGRYACLGGWFSACVLRACQNFHIQLRAGGVPITKKKKQHTQNRDCTNLVSRTVCCSIETQVALLFTRSSRETHGVRETMA